MHPGRDRRKRVRYCQPDPGADHAKAPCGSCAGETGQADLRSRSGRGGHRGRPVRLCHGSRCRAQVARLRLYREHERGGKGPDARRNVGHPCHGADRRGWDRPLFWRRRPRGAGPVRRGSGRLSAAANRGARPRRLPKHHVGRRVDDAVYPEFRYGACRGRGWPFCGICIWKRAYGLAVPGELDRL